MKIKVTLFCLIPALGLLPIACAETAPKENVEATVQAIIDQNQEQDVGLEEKAYSMARTMLEATAQSLPTASPTPPIPTATAVPSLPTATPSSVLGVNSWLNPYNSLIVHIDVTLTTPQKVFVEYSNPRAGRFRSKTSDYAETSHQLSLVRLRPSTTYSYEIFTLDDQGEGFGVWQGTFQTGPLPLGLRYLATISHGKSTYPLTLKEHDDDDFRGIVALDPQAYIVWYYESPHGAVTALGQKANGNLVYVANLSGLREITPLGEEVNRLDETCMTSKGQGQFHHEVLIQSNNKILYLSSAIHDAGRSSAIKPQTIDIVGEWNQENGTNRILFDLIDFIPFSDRTSDSNASDGFFWKGCHGAPEGVQDWTHSNSLFMGSRGNVIISIRHLDQIISIAPDFRSVEWRLGGPSSDFTFPNPGDQFYHQHSAVELPNGNVLLFDNGNLRPETEGGEYSRALELRLDFELMSAKKVWQYRHEPDLFAECCSNVTRLENGNTVMVFGADFTNEECCRVFTVIEANSSGAKVFEIQMRSPEMPIQYRVYPITSISGETQIMD